MVQTPRHEEIGLKEKSMRGGRVPALLCWKDRTRDRKRVSQGAYPKRRPRTIILVNNAKVWINKCKSLILSRATWRLEVIQHTSALTWEWRSKKVPNQRPNPLKGRGRDIKARAKVPNGGKNYMVANENSTYQWKLTRIHCMRCLRTWVRILLSLVVWCNWKPNGQPKYSMASPSFIHQRPSAPPHCHGQSFKVIQKALDLCILNNAPVAS